MKIPPALGRRIGGACFLNGNVPVGRDLVQMFREQILDPQHPDPDVRSNRRVLIVTAAWDSGHELRERHVIADFEEIGLDAGWVKGVPTRVQNLSVWTAFREWQEGEPWLYRRYTEKQDVIKALKYDYYVKNGEAIRRIREIGAELEKEYPALGLYEIISLERWREDPEEVLPRNPGSDSAPVARDLDRLWNAKQNRKKALEAARLLEHLQFKDSELFAACEAVEDHFQSESGVSDCARYQDQRKELIRLIDQSATMFLYGGRTFVLANRLRFYRLESAIRRAVHKGMNLFGISAGSIIQSEKWYLAEPEESPVGFLIAGERGLGLFRGVRVFPHAYGYYSYIREADRDALSFFALRQHDAVSVGLNEHSVLMAERYEHPSGGKTYFRFRSVGPDAVLVFGPRGERHEMAEGDELAIRGTRYYNGRPGLLRAEEIRSLESP